jgi:hypothetical protein
MKKNVYGDEEGRKSFGRTLGRTGVFFSGGAGNISSVSDVQMFCNQQMEKVFLMQLLQTLPLRHR